MMQRYGMGTISRRQMLKAIAAAAGCVLPPRALPLPGLAPSRSREDEAFLDDLERQGCLFFWEQGSPNTGQILDRARNDLAGARDNRRMASIASTGFGLTALCIADHRFQTFRREVRPYCRASFESVEGRISGGLDPLGCAAGAGSSLVLATRKLS